MSVSLYQWIRFVFCWDYNKQNVEARKKHWGVVVDLRKKGESVMWCNGTRWGKKKKNKKKKRRGRKKNMQAETGKVKSEPWQSNNATANSLGRDSCHWQHVNAPQQSSFRKHSGGHSEVLHISEILFKFRRKKSRVWHEWFFFDMFSRSEDKDNTVRTGKHMWAHLFTKALNSTASSSAFVRGPCRYATWGVF